MTTHDSTRTPNARRATPLTQLLILIGLGTVALPRSPAANPRHTTHDAAGAAVHRLNEALTTAHPSGDALRKVQRPLGIPHATQRRGWKVATHPPNDTEAGHEGRVFVPEGALHWIQRARVWCSGADAVVGAEPTQRWRWSRP
jgi:hypothetical protein